MTTETGDEAARAHRLERLSLELARSAVGRDISSTVSEITLMASVALDVQRASVWQFDGERSCLELLDLYEQSSESHSQGTSLERGDYPRYFEAVEQNRAVVAHDVHADPRTAEFSAGYTKPLGITSMLDASVFVSGEVVGLVCFEQVGEPRTWSDAEVRYAVNAADQVGQALIRHERDEALTRLRVQSELLMGLARAQADVVSGHVEYTKAWFDHVLETMLEFSGSAYGYVASVHHDENGDPFLRTHAITNIAWDDASRALYEEHKDSGMEFRNLDTLYGAVLKSGETLIFNDSGQDPRSGGIPGGHPPLNSFLGLPLTRGPDLVGMVGLANRPGGYDEEVALELRTLLGAAATILGFLQDQSELDQAHQQLASSEKRRQEAQRAVGRGDWEINLRDGTIVVSEAAAAVTGLEASGSPKDLREMLSERVHPKDLEAVLLQFEATSTLGVPADIEYRTLSRRDGEETWIRITAALIRDDSGRAVSISGEIEDITERRARESEVARVAEDLTRLVDTANTPIFGIDVDGLVNEWNQTAARITGYEKDEVMGRSLVDDFITEEYKQSVRAVLDTALGGVDTANFEFPLYSKSGDRLMILLNATARRDARGDVIGVVGVGQDITELDAAREELRAERVSLEDKVKERTGQLEQANLELERASRLKDEFLASMSHELRTPLNTILGMSEALAEGAYGALTEVQASQLGYVQESGDHLLTLINDILDVSKIEAGQMELDQGSVQLQELVDAALRLVGSGARKKRISLGRTDAPDVESITADGRRLKQVLANLLSNAVKFTPEGGRVGIDVEGDRTAGEVRITVWDEGIGISVEDQERLFQPFVQLDAGLDRQHAGTGLGLVLARKMTELHGGTLTLESELGEGSRFTVSIPWLKGTGETPAAIPSRSGKRRALGTDGADAPNSTLGRIVLAEDNEMNIQTYATYLRQKGYEVLVARDGLEALELVRAERPGLILMDVQMPNMDGLEATRRIRSWDEGGDVPIVALTAMAMPGDEEKCLEAGADAYLSKPVKLTELVQTIEQHIVRA